MASLIERKNKEGKTTRWQVRWRAGTAQLSESFDNREAAVGFKRILEKHGGDVRKAERDLLSAVSRAPRFEAVAQQHLDGLTDVEQHTMHTYERMLVNHLHPAFQGMPIDSIQPSDISDWIADAVHKGKSPKTIKNVHGLLFSIMRTAVKKGLRPDNPCEDSRLPKNRATQDTTTFLTQAEFAHILSHVRAHYQPFFMFLVGTGLRFSEAAALQPGDFTDDGGFYTVRVTKAWKRIGNYGREIGPPKSARGRRTVPLSTSLANVVAPLVKATELDGYVFRSEKDSALTVQAARRFGWNPAVQAAQSEGLRKTPRIHDLRHTYASWMLTGEPPLSMFELSRLMGHESVSTTTKVYSHLMPETLVHGASIMDSAFARVAGAAFTTAQIER